MPGTIPPERSPSSSLGEAPTVLRAKVKDDGTLEIGSSAFLDELGPSSPDSEERAASLVGTLISGRYRADEILGQGGMGAVLGGEQIHLRKRVAIKVLHPGTEKLPGLVDRFEREAVAGAHVQHPNVAAAIDFGKLDDGSYFLVLEYVEGIPLSDVIDQGPLPAARALRIARQMADALAAVHAKGIVHRDIKPQNTMLGPEDQVKIIDFGLAKVDIGSTTGRASERKDVPLTAAGVVFGTPAYLAPEAALGMGAVDARSDLYALGVTLYEMLCGCLPFEGSSPGSIFRQQRLSDPPVFSVRAPGVPVPAEAERIAMRLVQRDPAERYQSARETVAAIDEALLELERKPADAPLASPSASRGGGRATRWTLALAVGSLALGSAVAVAFRGVDTRVVPSAAPPARPVPVAPPPSASAATLGPAEPEDADIAVQRAHLDKAIQIKDWVLGAKSFLALAHLDSKLLDDADNRARVVAVAAGIGHEAPPNDLADAVFDVLENRLGEPGLDVLYDLALSRGGTRAGQRAKSILARPSVAARESPALRVAFDVFVARCTALHALLSRAAADGDRRTLVQLEVAHGAHCTNKKDPCCFRDDAAMAAAIAKIKARGEN